MLDEGDWNLRLDREEYINIRMFSGDLRFNVLEKTPRTDPNASLRKLFDTWKNNIPK